MTRRLLSCVPALILALARFAGAQTYEVIHRSPGGYTIAPSGFLLAMADGTFYGTTATGGEFGQGSIFRLTSNGSGLVWTDVHSFSGPDGASPQGELRLGGDGFIYGSTLAGGASGAGTVFAADRSGRLTLLYDFSAGGGSLPSPVFPALDGSLYGTTATGGTHGQGTFFRLDPSGNLTTLHNFGDPGDGTAPAAGVMLANDGFFWGTTPLGGASGSGTIFRVDSGGGFQTMHSFAGSTTDGFEPTGSLVERGGSLYGTTATGAIYHVFGTLFRLDAAGNPTTLRVFDTDTGGAPIDGLAIGVDGNLYGVTRDYTDPLTQAFYPGVLFRIDGSDTFSIVPTSGPGQHLPTSGLTTGADGDLYGNALAGNYSYGAVVQVTTAGAIAAAFVVPPQRLFERYAFQTPLFEDADQSLYGGASGLAFLKIDPSGTEFAWNVPNDVNNPINALIRANDQNFYTTLAGSPGQFVRLDPAGNLTRLYTFDYYVTGAEPRAVFQGPDGYFYGAAYAGGPNNLGTIFRLDTAGNAVSLHDLALNEGASPSSALLPASDGDFYGTTLYGGQGGNGNGNLFRFDPLALTLTPIHEFTGPDGSLPVGRLIQASDGYIYGTTVSGGLNGQGVIYRSDLAGNVTKLYDATAPLSDTVIERADGFFYGCMRTQVFKMDSTGNVTTVHSFSDPETCPSTGLLLGLDGSLYGTTSLPGAGGTAFRISDTLSPPEWEGLAPTSGRSAGGASIRISGHHFRDGLSVSIGGVSAVGILVDREALLTAIVPAFPPGTLQDVSVTDAPAGSAAAVAAWFSDFLDASGNQIFHDYIETIFRAGITKGCGMGDYCPDDPVTRAQMAVFLLKGEHGGSYLPPGCTSTVFADVPCPGGTNVNWINQLNVEGITGGCGGGNYCPADPVQRQQMAPFLLKAKHGSSSMPPPCAGIFQDVPCPSLFAPWIEELFNEGITGGCSVSPPLFCPSDPNTRGQMAVFLTKTFGLVPQ